MSIYNKKSNIDKKQKWKNLPKGWTEESLEKFIKTLMSDSEHPFRDCVKKLKESEGMKNPEAFCAKAKDILKGDTSWRQKDRLKNNLIKLAFYEKEFRPEILSLFKKFKS